MTPFLYITTSFCSEFSGPRRKMSKSGGHNKTFACFDDICFWKDSHKGHRLFLQTVSLASRSSYTGDTGCGRVREVWRWWHVRQQSILDLCRAWLMSSTGSGQAGVLGLKIKLKVVEDHKAGIFIDLAWRQWQPLSASYVQTSCRPWNVKLVYRTNPKSSCLWFQRQSNSNPRGIQESLMICSNDWYRKTQESHWETQFIWTCELQVGLCVRAFYWVLVSPSCFSCLPIKEVNSISKSVVMKLTTTYIQIQTGFTGEDTWEKWKKASYTQRETYT